MCIKFQISLFEDFLSKCINVVQTRTVIKRNFGLHWELPSKIFYWLKTWSRCCENPDVSSSFWLHLWIIQCNLVPFTSLIKKGVIVVLNTNRKKGDWTKNFIHFQEKRFQWKMWSLSSLCALVLEFIESWVLPEKSSKQFANRRCYIFCR